MGDKDICVEMVNYINKFDYIKRFPIDLFVIFRNVYKTPLTVNSVYFVKPLPVSPILPKGQIFYYLVMYYY